MTRQDTWINYAKWLTRQEKLYVPKVRKAMQAQIKKFIDKLLDSDLAGARREAESEIINGELLMLITKMHRSAGLTWALRWYRELRRETRKYSGIGFNEEWTSAILNFFRDNNLMLVGGITTTTREMLLTFLNEGIEEGLSIEQIVQRILERSNVIVRNRAYTIVRTELNAGANAGTVAGASTLEYETNKEWLTSRDHRVRGQKPKDKFSHVVLDGDSVELDGKFNNGEFLDFPGDPKASAANRINCRCTLLVRPKRDDRGRLIPRQGGIRINTNTVRA